MGIATVGMSILLAAFLAFSAIRKLSHQPPVVESYVRAGVPENKLNYLAFVLVAAAAGLIAGLFVAPIGIAAAIGVVIYFLGAVGFHIRANDMKHLPTPLLVAVFAALVLILQVAFA
jgi:hypothetical protein